jgi:hypothetical protein
VFWLHAGNNTHSIIRLKNVLRELIFEVLMILNFSFLDYLNFCGTKMDQEGRRDILCRRPKA